MIEKSLEFQGQFQLLDLFKDFNSPHLKLVGSLLIKEYTDEETLPSVLVISFSNLYIKKSEIGCKSEYWYISSVKGRKRISKRALQENKARQIFRKTNISYPLIRTRTCAFQVVINVRFGENLMCFVSL